MTNHPVSAARSAMEEVAPHLANLSADVLLAMSGSVPACQSGTVA